MNTLLPMKVLHQLINHFWRRGVLTVEQAHYLVKSGFIRAWELDWYTPRAAPPDVDEPIVEDRCFPDIDHTPDPLEEQSTRRQRRAKAKFEAACRASRTTRRHSLRLTCESSR